MEIRTTEEIGIAYSRGVVRFYTRKLAIKRGLNINKKWVAVDNEVEEALALYYHLKGHKEVKEAKLNKGMPICKICGKTAKELKRKDGNKIFKEK